MPLFNEVWIDLSADNLGLRETVLELQLLDLHQGLVLVPELQLESIDLSPELLLLLDVLVLGLLLRLDLRLYVFNLLVNGFDALLHLLVLEVHVSYRALVDLDLLCDLLLLVGHFAQSELVVALLLGVLGGDFLEVGLHYLDLLFKLLGDILFLFDILVQLLLKVVVRHFVVANIADSILAFLALRKSALGLGAELADS